MDNVFCPHEEAIWYTMNCKEPQQQTTKKLQSVLFSNTKSSSLFVSGNYSLTNKAEDSRKTSLLTYRNVYIGAIEFSICRKRLLQKTTTTTTTTTKR